MSRLVPTSNVTSRVYPPSLLLCDDMYSMFSTPMTCCSIYLAEALKLSFPPVKIAVVIFVRGDEFGLADVIDHLYSVDDLHGNRQLGDPRRAIGLFLQEISRGRGIADPRRGTHVVVHFART